MKRAAFALVLVALLAGCGTRNKLRPLPGMAEVPMAAGAEERETPLELMTPSTQTRPDRRVDLLTRSEERPEDPFDLPPGPDNGRPVATQPAPASAPAPDAAADQPN